MKQFVSGATVGAVVTLVLAGGTAYAATGGSFILGKANSAGAQTNLKNTGSGPVLSLSTKTGQAPLAVSSSAGKAPHLNADKVDGLDGSQLALASGRVGTVSAFAEVFEDEDGRYVGGFAECPPGSKVTGGGFFDDTDAPAVIDAPVDNGWLFITRADADSTEDDVLVFANCYNPRGAVAGADEEHLRAGSGHQTMTPEQRERVGGFLR